jgi:hypothetical protein
MPVTGDNSSTKPSIEETGITAWFSSRKGLEGCKQAQVAYAATACGGWVPVPRWGSIPAERCLTPGVGAVSGG